jgi:flavodoxin
MKAIVVYESLWGNTEQVARSIAAGLTRHLEVTVLEVAAAPETIPDDVILTVVGGPTHAFSLSRPQTRHEAFEQGATQGGEAVGIREWIGRLHRTDHDGPVATFDTRIDKVRRLPGSAAKRASKLARREGFAAAADPESFYVSDTEGPLLPGELDRARDWGVRLGEGAERRSKTPSA